MASSSHQNIPGASCFSFQRSGAKLRVQLPFSGPVGHAPPLPGTNSLCILFCFGRAHGLMRRHMRMTRIYFCFCWSRMIRVLFWIFLTGGTLCQGAYIGTQQFVRPRRTISPWPCCFWSSPSLRGPWRALVFWSSPRPRPFNRTAAWAWLVICCFWIRNVKRMDFD